MASTDRDVLYITLSDLSASSGDSIATMEIVKAFARNDEVSLHLVCPEPVGKLPDVITENTHAFYHLWRRDDPSILRRVLEQGDLFRRVESAIRSVNPDFIVARMNPTLLVPPVLAKVHGIPYVLLARGISYKTLPFSPILKQIFRLNARIADRVYAAYQAIKADADAVRGPDQPPTKVFENGVDPELFEARSIHAARNELDIGFDEDDFVVGSVSTLKPYHKLDEVIRGIAALQDEMDLKLLVVGDGPERNHLEDLVKKLELDDDVIFTGFVPHDDVDTYIASADVLYGANDAENAGNPIKCYEYLACGRPIIATATPEFEFVEERDFGVTIRKTNKESIIQAIRELYELDDEERQQMGAGGREYVLKHRTWDALVREIMADPV